MSESTARNQPRGRRRDPAKREALLDAARQMALRGGVESFTMEEVITSAGVARGTLYAYFPDKAALFEAMIARESERLVTDAWVLEHQDVDPVSALVIFGERLLAFFCDSQAIGFERVVQGAALTFPDLAARFYEVGPGRARAILKRLIVSAQKEGLIRECDLETALNDLSGLWQGFLRVELTFRRRPSPDAQELRRRSEHGVKQFLALYGAAGQHLNSPAAQSVEI